MRAPFYPFKLADLDDKGSCLIPLCASEYTKTDNPKESTRLAQQPARRCGSHPIWHEGSRKRKENKQTTTKTGDQNWDSLVCWVQTDSHSLPAPESWRLLPRGSAPWSFPGAAGKQGSTLPTSGKDSSKGLSLGLAVV